MMKIILAPDSFKGSLTAPQVCKAMADGIAALIPDAAVVKMPMADGGEGTVEAVVTATAGEIIPCPARDPLGREIRSFFGLTGDRSAAIIEMAAASGLPLLSEAEKNPLITSTYGTGQLIRAALDLGVKKIILGIGGSATNDGGTGMAKALGVRFLDAAGLELKEGGGDLGRLARIERSGLDPRIASTEFLVACDVTNPLTGPEGAAAVYGPQKGATPEMVAQLDAGLERLAERVREELGQDIQWLPGAGAAGGLGGGLVAFLNARLTSGIELVMEVTQFEKQLQDAQLVLTGEGRIDFQSAFGKTISGVGKLAGAAGVPVIGIAGSLGAGYEQVYQSGITAVTSIISRPMTLEEALADSQRLIREATARSLKFFLAGAARRP
ncbi:glycerate kinase [Hydrogenispora ethanolica]|uniref:Glycerate kinase n=2 Tax=Hydrogenispora ethanolica TaxID=1082276 RepID=A0A4R1RFN7_HYDET|nr:glycerate kinase [Hydrogenispora ethanolica]